MYACTSHVPPTVALDKRAMPAAPPAVIVPTVAPALSVMVSVPVALLLNWKVVVSVKVVASGNLNVWLPVPFKVWLNAEAAVNVVVPPAAVTLFVLWLKRLIVMFWLASRKTTELAPEEAVTPVPP